MTGGVNETDNDDTGGFRPIMAGAGAAMGALALGTGLVGGSPIVAAGALAGAIVAIAGVYKSFRNPPSDSDFEDRRDRARRLAPELGLKEVRSHRAKRSLREAAAMGFYGPGFAGSPRPALGGPMSSSGRLAWLTEAEAAPADAGAEPIEIKPEDIKQILTKMGMDKVGDEDIEGVLAALNDPQAIEIANSVEPKAEEVAEEIRVSLEESAASGYARAFSWGVVAPVFLQALKFADVVGKKTPQDMDEMSLYFAVAGALVALGTAGVVKLSKP
jgi:hypothetical protein